MNDTGENLAAEWLHSQLGSIGGRPAWGSLHPDVRAYWVGVAATVGSLIESSRRELASGVPDGDDGGAA